MAAAVFAMAVLAGIIASSNGSEMATPAPFRTVRRERNFLVRNMAYLPPVEVESIDAVLRAGAGAAGARRRNASLFTTPITMDSNV